MNLFVLDSNPAPNLKGISLERVIKKTLVEKSFNNNSSANIIASKYNISIHTIKKYRNYISNDIPLFKYEGRPTKIDTEGINLILQKVREHNSINEDMIRQEIKLQAHQTLLRRYPKGVPLNKSKKISRHTVYRWSLYIKLMIEEEKSQLRDEL
jgi:hypothetical protein